jgi:AcrR family transcriptional regulator
MTQVEAAERRGGRPRSEDADRAIIKAALDLLGEVGFTSLTIERVASEAGVGKTTVYRRWPNKEALIVDAMAELKGPIPDVPGRSLREDMLTMLQDQARGREAARRRRIYACFVGESARNPELARRYAETVLEPRREVMRRAVRAAVARGELRNDLDIEVVLHLLMAPVLHWSLRNPDEPIDVELMTLFFDATFEGLAAR